VFAVVTAEAGRLLTADVAFLTRYDPDGTEIVLGAWAGAGAPPVAVGTRVALGGRDVSSLVFQTSRSARIDGYADATGPIADVAREGGVRASAGVPISVADRLWGVIVVAFTHKGVLPADTEARLAGFTELTATAVANAQAQADEAALDGGRTFSLPASRNAGSREGTRGGRMLAAMHDCAAEATL